MSQRLNNMEQTDPITKPSDDHLEMAKVAQEDVAEDEQDEFRVDFRLFMAVLFLLMGYEAAAFLLVLVSPIMTYINNDLGPVSYYAWIAISWSMANGICITVAGRMMDIWGRRWPMILGNLLGLIGTIIGATANNVGTVIAGVAIGGVGAGLQQQATACLAELVPRRYRPMSSALVSAALIISLFGTPIAYTFVQKLSWRWSFYTAIMTNGIAMIGTYLFYFPPTFSQKHRMDGLTKMQELARFDWTGLCLFVGSLVSLTLGINWGGSVYPWKSAGTIAPIVVGFVGLLAFGAWESSPFVKEPLVPPVLTKDVRGFVMVLVVTFVAGMLLYALISYWPLEVATMYSSDLTTIGWMGMTVYGSTVVGSLLLGGTIHKLGHSKQIYIAGTLLMTIFISSMAAMTPDTRAAAVTLSILGGLSTGFVQLLSTAIVVVRVDDQYIGTAIGLLGTARLIGGAVATAIYSAVLTNKVNEVLPKNIASAVLPLGFETSNLGVLIQALLTGSSTALSQVPGITPEIIGAAASAVKVSYAQGFKIIYLVSLAFGVCAIFAALFTKGMEEKMDNKVSVKLNPVTPVANIIHHHADERAEKLEA